MRKILLVICVSIISCKEKSIIKNQIETNVVSKHSFDSVLNKVNELAVQIKQKDAAWQELTINSWVNGYEKGMHTVLTLTLQKRLTQKSVDAYRVSDKKEFVQFLLK